MKILLIGDVHANLHALEEVLADSEGDHPDAVWNVGDFVGYGAFPDEVVQRIRSLGAVSIAGNHDLKVLSVKRKKRIWRLTKNRLNLLALEWAYHHLTQESLRHLRSLPLEVRFEVEECPILLTHGSPGSNEDGLSPDVSNRRFKKLAKSANAEFVICGHSHIPFARPVNGTCFINTGSVGRPSDGDQRASYALLYLNGKKSRVEHRRIPYDVKAAVQAIRDQDLPEAFAQMLIRGRKLRVVQRQGVKKRKK